MAKSANGTTVTFNSASVGSLTDISFSDGANEIDVTTLDASTHVFEEGIADVECTVTVLGVPSIDRGDTGALSISWNDGGSDSISSALVTNVDSSGGLDGAIETSITFKPAAA